MAQIASSGFVETAFQARLRQLVRDKDPAGATRVLLDALPDIQHANVNAKEKLHNLLFLARAIQDGGGAKYGHAKLRAKIRPLSRYLQDRPLPAGGFIELGCGVHDPISMALYFYLNGLEPACGIDLLSPRNDHFSGVSVYDILANVAIFPERYLWAGRQPEALLARLRTIDAASFESGDFWGGLDSLAGKVRLIDEDLRQCDLPPRSIALLTSYAVLEHVTDIDAIFARCFELMAPGAMAYHFGDLADHRSYRGDGAYGPLSFLTEAVAPANMNRLRAPDIAGAARRAGFDVLVDRRIAADLGPELAARLVPPFADMPAADVAIVKQHLVLRKPD